MLGTSRWRDRWAGRFCLEVGESRGRVHLEAVPVAIGRPVQVYPGDGQPCGDRETPAPVLHILGEAASPDLDSVPRWVPVVVRLGYYLAGEELLSRHVDPIVPPGDVLLELGRAAGHVCEAFGVSGFRRETMLRVPLTDL